MEEKKPPALKIRRSIQNFMTESRNKIFDVEFNEDKFELVNVEIELKDLNPIFDEYKIINLSDIHLGQWVNPLFLEGIVDYVNKQNPDMITLTGDYVSYILDEYEKPLEESFKKLKAKDKKIAVLGNHDHWLGAETIRKILKNADIIDVSNDVYTLDKSNLTNEDELKPVLHIAGVDSIMVGKDDFNKVMKKLPKEGPAILLSHEPDFAEISSSTGRFGLQISGHSHGGQFIIPGIGTTIFKGSHSTEYPVGEYQVKDMIQYTSKGLGTNIFWLRINCNPEITVFTLKCSRNKKIKVDYSNYNKKSYNITVKKL